MVSFSIANGNPGAMAFLVDAYKIAPFMAESGFQRMSDAGIVGHWLYMLWNDCCERDTRKALRVMNEMDITSIIFYLNNGRGRGIQIKEVDGEYSRR